jgi:hypothetical protein
MPVENKVKKENRSCIKLFIFHIYLQKNLILIQHIHNENIYNIKNLKLLYENGMTYIVNIMIFE